MELVCSSFFLFTMESITYKGLTDAQVLESRRKNGVNVLTPPEKDPWWKEFLDKFTDPLIIILLVAGVLSIGISFYEFFGLGQDWKVFFEPIGIFRCYWFGYYTGIYL